MAIRHGIGHAIWSARQYATRYRRPFLILGIPALGVYALDRKLRDLEARYPALPVNDTTCSVAVRTPNNSETQHTAYIDIYSAPIHLETVTRGAKITLQEFKQGQNYLHALLSWRWAQVIMSSHVLRTEGCIIGLFTGRGWNPGDYGQSVEAFGPAPDQQTSFAPSKGGRKSSKGKRELLNGAFVVERGPGLDNGHGLLVSWKLPDGPRLFFEKIGRWGYPWRLMSGGRHEFSISFPYYIPGREEEGLVYDLRFASAHDYELVPGEGDIQNQKIIPRWTARLHRGYARWILDRALREYEWRARERGRMLKLG